MRVDEYLGETRRGSEFVGRSNGGGVEAGGICGMRGGRGTLCDDQNIRLTSFNFEDVLRLSTAIRKVAGRDPGQARGV